MKVETFYWIISDDNKIHSQKYAQHEIQPARMKLVDLAKANQGSKFHLMRRVTSVLVGDMFYEDSE